MVRRWLKTLRIHTLAAQLAVDPAELIEREPGRVDAYLNRPDIQRAAGILIDLFRQSRAPNYFAVTAYDVEHGGAWEVLIRPQHSRTPSLVNADLRAALQQIIAIPEDAKAIATAALAGSRPVPKEEP